MKVEQLYTGCLAEAAYYIESNGEAAIIDPLRDNDIYIQKAKEGGAKIKYIFETHFHADFVSGHVDLARKTGAKIVYGPNATAEFDFHQAKDNEEFKIGNITIKVLHTPGHTMESSTYLLIDENGKNHAIFTGDTLFLGDVGRPDLAVKSDFTEKDLAVLLFDSLRQKIMILGDDVIVYPGHGAGSACGKNMSKETIGTLGDQKKTNYALRADMTKEEFVKELLDGILPPPQYFAKNAMMNKKGISALDDVLEKGLKALSPDEAKKLIDQENILILDTRKPADFVKSHIKNSWFIGIDGSFAVWVGTLIEDLNQKIILVADEGREQEVVTRLSRVGYDNTIGYIKGGVYAWLEAGYPISNVVSIDAETFEKEYNKNAKVIDVRKPSEFEAEHVEGAESIPLDFIKNNYKQIPDSGDLYIHCAGGYRSLIEISILKSKGYNNKLINIEGGFGAISKTEIPKTAFVCQSSK